MDTDPMQAPPAGVYSRRTFLRLAGASGAVLGTSGLLAACGGSSASSSGSAASSGSSVGPVGGPFNLFTWQGYDLTKPFKQWRAENNIQQTVKYINNQFDVATILKGPGGQQFDSSSANQAYTHLFQSLNVMSPLTTADIGRRVGAGRRSRCRRPLSSRSSWARSDRARSSSPGSAGFS